MGEADEQRVVNRPVRAGSFAFVVGADDPAVARALDLLLRDLSPAETAASDLPAFEILDVAPGVRHRYVVTGPQIGRLGPFTLAGAVTLLTTGINLGALDAEPERLHLHAAAVARDGRALLIAAPRETGKTTTLARLVLRGWDYLSDETVSLDGSGEEVRAFAKPLSIKPSGRRHVPELVPHLAPSADLDEADVAHVALGDLGVDAVPAAEPRVIVVLRRRPDGGASATPSSRRLHPADAVVALMGETLDAARFGPAAAGALARLACRAACHEVVLGDPERTADLLEELFEGAVREDHEVTERAPTGRIEDHVRSVQIGDRLVAHEQPEGRILALDPAAAQVWMTLGGWIDAGIDLDGPVVAPFVEQLAAMGLIRRDERAEASAGER